MRAYFPANSFVKRRKILFLGLCSGGKRDDHCEMALDIGVKRVPYQKRQKLKPNCYHGFPYSYVAYPSVVCPPGGVHPAKK